MILLSIAANKFPSFSTVEAPIAPIDVSAEHPALGCIALLFVAHSHPQPIAFARLENGLAGGLTGLAQRFPGAAARECFKSQSSNCTLDTLSDSDCGPSRGARSATPGSGQRHAQAVPPSMTRGGLLPFKTAQVEPRTLPAGALGGISRARNGRDCSLRNRYRLPRSGARVARPLPR